jgi:NAD(P)-dependent dehydrogenase (short-subunit alcohol dehydrogenase family)
MEKRGILDSFSLGGRTALVTGGSRGIGRSIAVGLAEAGADIGIISRQTRQAGEALAKELRELGRIRSFATCADVTDRKAIDAVVADAVRRWGRVDILVANAGIGVNVPAEDMAEEDWDRIIDVNVKGVFLCAQAVAKQMIGHGGGAIIAIGSMSGVIVNDRPQACYNASKAAVHMLVKCLATEWAQYNIRVNCIAPGFIMTEMLKPFLADHSAEAEEYMIRPAVQKRIGAPEELAGAAVYLASDASSYMTGGVMVIDGGYTLR